MNLNVLLLVFVLGGYVVFTAIFESETADTSGTTTGTSNFAGSLINTELSAITALNLTSDIQALTSFNCGGFTSCVEAVASAVGHFLLLVVKIIAVVLLLVAIMLTVLIVPLPNAPIYLQLVVYVIEIGLGYVIIGVFRGGE